MTSVEARDRCEIDGSIYDPFDPATVQDPFPIFDRLLAHHPVAFHTDLGAWLISPHDLAAQVLRDPRLSTDKKHWGNLGEPKPQSQWTLWDEVQSASISALPPDGHLRLRRLCAPAFSRPMTDRLEPRIRATVAGVFDEIDDPSEFNVATDVATKLPIRVIADLLGIPHEERDLFENGFARNLLRAADPAYVADRARYAERTVAGLEYLLHLIRERRAEAGGDGDFFGTLSAAEVDGQQLGDTEILSLVVALVTAGVDTVIDLHTSAIHALLRNPEQRRLLRERPILMDNATIEIIRWSASGKFGAIPRFPVEDVTVGGQTFRAGDFVLPLMSAAWNDPGKWPDPRRFDIRRDHAGNIIFGTGPHLCIGLNLVKAQARAMIEEFDRRFGDTAELVGEPEYDPSDFTSRRITKLTVRTAGHG